MAKAIFDGNFKSGIVEVEVRENENPDGDDGWIVALTVRNKRTGQILNEITVMPYPHATLSADVIVRENVYGAYRVAYTSDYNGYFNRHEPNP